MRATGILETVLYAENLGRVRPFYEDVLGLECFQASEDRQLFFYCGDQVLLIFDPAKTSLARPPAAGVPPAHGARGAGHVCFRAEAAELDRWRSRLEEAGIAIEADFEWPAGGRSLYVRDPAGNSVEFAEPRIWRLPRRVRTLRGAKLVVASHNRGKRKEIDDLLRPFGVETVMASDLGLPEPEETEATFAGNARLKAEHAAMASGLAAISDDSGLCVDSLHGDPGIYSARWAGPFKDFALAMRNVEEKLQAIGATTPDTRRAHFISALAVAWPDGETRCYEGRVDGILVWPPRGTQGFGYDPMFLPEGATLTFGEMEPQAKHAVSHRARAFAKLVDDLF
ncbi:MAG: RdgB/HAM1 family non-canonical purine NTP pyrophosphatase [Rhizobiales bacterium]|nr:RdgB/HAM1 family non-canonical purine NTP pyrophosphatase [Hyphomicrobiales bacterium]